MIARSTNGSVISVAVRRSGTGKTEMVTISKEENETTMAWLEEELEQADGRGQSKLACLLRAVRDDIAFELELTEELSVNR